jgi:hypothetical protein
MRLLAFGSALALLSLAGCSPGTLGGTGGTGGATGTGGTGGTTGTGGTGGTTGTGGATGGSPGTVTLRINVPPTQTFCDENPSCSSTQHLWVMTASGQALTLGSVGCNISCSACAGLPCPELPIVACPAGNYGVAVTDYDFTWDGSYLESSACEPSGASIALSCLDAKVAPAGTYVARFCATPGVLNTTDGGVPSCTPTGPQECVEVRFDLPSSQPVVITLPTD